MTNEQNEKTRATKGRATVMNSRAAPETDEEILDRIAGEILDAHLEDEDQYLRERREEERVSA